LHVVLRVFDGGFRHHAGSFGSLQEFVGYSRLQLLAGLSCGLGLGGRVSRLRLVEVEYCAQGLLSDELVGAVQLHRGRLVEGEQVAGHGRHGRAADQGRPHWLPASSRGHQRARLVDRREVHRLGRQVLAQGAWGTQLAHMCFVYLHYALVTWSSWHW